MLIVRSPVRISFAGGGTDLPAYYEKFGGAVLSTSINKYFYTVLQKRNDERIQVISSDLRIMETWQDISCMNMTHSELAIPLAVIKELGCDISVDLFLASQIVVSGHVRIRHNCFIGVNATLRNSITIAPQTLIGAGAVIMKDTVEKGVYLSPRAELFTKQSDEIEL